MPNHTPGPWYVGMRPGPMIYGAKGVQVADLRGDLLSPDETRANLKMIAAVPDLHAATLHAFHWLMDSFGNSPDQMPNDLREHLRAALHRADGEPRFLCDLPEDICSRAQPHKLHSASA